MKKQTIIISLCGFFVTVLFIWLFTYMDVFKGGKGTPPGSEPEKKESKKPAQLSSSHKDMALMFSPKNGDMLSYRFSMTSDSKLTSAIFSAGETPSNDEFVNLAMNFTGDLFMKFFLPVRPGEDMNVSCVIENLTMALNGQKTDYSGAMTSPFAVQMDAKGYFNDFIFSPGVPGEAQLMIKSLIYTMQTVYPKERNQIWKTREIDSTGQYQAEYRIADKRSKDGEYAIYKTKKAYLLLLSENSSMGEGLVPTEVRIEKSDGKTRVSAEGAWILSTDRKEVSVIMAENKKLGRSSIEFSAERQDKTPVTAFAGKFTDALSAVKSPSWLKEKYTVTDPELNAVGANLDLDAALLAYLTMSESETSAERRKAEKFMVNYLRQNPRACYDLVRYLDADPKRERFSHESQLALWRLITEAGHEDAQKAVLEAISNTSFSDLTHIRALAYIHDFEYPEAFVAKGLWDFYNSVDMEKGDDASKELGTMSLYAIGSLGSEEKLNEALKPEIGKTLADNLKSSQDTETQVVTLQAIGNYGGTDVIDQVKPYFTSDSERIRIAAYESIRRMDSSVAFDTFVTSYSSESSQNVRSSALKILESMPVSDESITWAGKEVLKVDESADQESLAKVLGKNIKEYPKAEEPLRQLLAKKPSNIVKKTVYRYIAPK